MATEAPGARAFESPARAISPGTRARLPEMSPTDLPETPTTGEGFFHTRRPENVPRPPDCAITEEEVGEREQFTITPQKGVVPGPQLFFAFMWAGMWTVGVLLYVLLPNEYGPGLNFFALLVAVAGEYLALMVLVSALLARFAVERISLGPEGVVKERRLGPFRFTRRATLSRARAFRIDAFPVPREHGKWSTHLYLIVGSPDAGGDSSGKIDVMSFQIGEGARDEDKYWLASRLNAGLRTRREALTRRI